MFAIFLASVVTFLLLPRLLSFLFMIWRRYRMGSKFPGPYAKPIVGNALDIPKRIEEWALFFKDRTNEVLRNGHNVTRIWLAHSLHIMPLNGMAAKGILDSMVEITKSDDYEIVRPWLGTGLLLSTGQKWKDRRRMLTPTFHFAMLDGYIETMDTEARLLTEILDEDIAGKDKQVDIFGYIKRCALDIICKSIMGYQLNSQKEHNHPYAVAVGDMTYLATIYIMRPWLWFPPIWYLSGWASKYNAIVKTLTDFSKDVIAKRKEMLSQGEEEPIAAGGRKAFLDMLLEMREENALSDEDIREEVDTFIFEGHDTTTSGMAWTVWALATHPEIQEKVAEELFSIFGASDRDITLADIKQMHYLDRVIKESLRLNPPVPYVGRRLQNDFEIDRHVAPSGSDVNINPITLHRNEQVYLDPMRFDPDRFLPENVKNRHAYDYIPFSAGPRNCIGQKFAVYEEKVIISWLVRKFKISSNIPFHDNACCPEVSVCISAEVFQVILRPELGVPVRLERREWL